jgi:hypothetical protein
VATGLGAWPVWIDDDEIDAIRDIGLGRSQIIVHAPFQAA